MLGQVWTSRRQNLPSRSMCGFRPLLFCRRPNQTTRRVLCWNDKRPETTTDWWGEIRFLPLASRADLNSRRYVRGRVIYYPVDTAFFPYLLFNSVHSPVRREYVSPQKRSAPTTVVHDYSDPVAVSNDRQWSMNPSRRPVDRRISSSPYTVVMNSTVCPGTNTGDGGGSDHGAPIHHTR